MRVVPLSAVKLAPKRAEVGSEVDDDVDVEHGSSLAYCSLSSSRNSVVASSGGEKHRRQGVKSVLYRYPRLCFLIILLCCTFIAGGHVAYYVSQWTLELRGARSALRAARTQLLTTEVALRSTSKCVVTQSMTRALLAKTELEQHGEKWAAAVQEQVERLDEQHRHLETCADSKLKNLESVLADQSRMECIANSSRVLLAQYEGKPGAKLLVDRVRQLVDSAFVRAALDKASQQQQPSKDSSPFQSRVAEVAKNSSEAIVSTMNAWFDGLVRAVKHDMTALTAAIDLPDLPVIPDDWALPELIDKTTSNGNQVEPPLLSRHQLMSMLRAAAGININVTRLIDGVEKSLFKMMEVADQLVKQQTAIRDELRHARNMTKTMLNESIEGFQDVMTKMRESLDTAAKESMSTMIEGITDMMDESYQAELDRHRIAAGAIDRLHRQYLQWTTRPSTEIPYAWSVVPVPQLRFDPLHGPIQDLEKRSHALDSVDSDDPSEIQVRRNEWLFRASFFDLSAIIVSIVLWWDAIARIKWFLQRSMMVFTESYTDLAPVDIRDITSINSLIDLWGVLKCKHDVTSVMYTFLTEGLAVLETASHFVLWVLLELIGTTFLVWWKRDYLERCRSSSSTSINDSTYLGFIAWLLMDHKDASTATMLRPTTIVDKETKQLQAALRDISMLWHHQIDTLQDTLDSRGRDFAVYRQFTLDLNGILEGCAEDQQPVAAGYATDCVGTLANEDSALSWSLDSVELLDNSTFFTALQSDEILTLCLPDGAKAASLTTRGLVSPSVERLQLAHSCAMDQTMYLTFSSWWMVFITGLSLRFIARMIIKTVGITWWRYLSADRLQFIGFCDDGGGIHAAERLPDAVRRHLRNVRWRVGARMIGVVLGVVTVIAVGSLTLPPAIMQVSAFP